MLHRSTSAAVARVLAGALLLALFVLGGAYAYVQSKKVSTITVAITGKGRVVSKPKGIDCPTRCRTRFRSGRLVKLSAKPRSGWRFAGWRGSCKGASSCKIKVNKNVSVRAVFRMQVKVEVVKNGDGEGTVVSVPAGINCGKYCSAVFSKVKTIALTAKATEGSTFMGWSGACSGTGTCKLNMSKGHEVSVVFAITGKAPSWTVSFPGSRSAGDQITAMSTGGQRLFAIGQVAGHYATVAYNPATGKQLWLSSFKGDGNFVDYPSSIAATPDGQFVFVTGTSGAAQDYEHRAAIRTVAYDGANGNLRWSAEYQNSYTSNYSNHPKLVLSSVTGTLFVTGAGSETDNFQLSSGYETFAYNADSGQLLWAARYDGGSYGSPTAVSASPDGQFVFVTGWLGKKNVYGTDIATVAYKAQTQDPNGSQLWAARFNGGLVQAPDTFETDVPSSISVSPDGQKLFVAGSDKPFVNFPPPTNYETIAYSVGGEQLWASRYHQTGEHAMEHVDSIAVSPNGQTVFVSGSSTADTLLGNSDATTVAYNTLTGQQSWMDKYPGDLQVAAGMNVISPNGQTMYVLSVGQTKNDVSDIVAYNLITRSKQLFARCCGGLWLKDGGFSSMVISPDGQRLYVASTDEAGKLLINGYPLH